MIDWMTSDISAMPPCANVLGVGVHATNMEAAVEAIGRAIAVGRKGYVCLTGVHGVMEARRDRDLHTLFDKAFLCLPDGMPTVWVGRLQGFRDMRRVFGPDLMLEVFRRSERSRFSHYLLGGGEGVAQQLGKEMAQRFPAARIVGSYTPPFRELTPKEEAELVESVGRLRPDILWVGLSTPKQERFMAKYLPHLHTKLMIGVGAAFDIHTGRIKDSPLWMKQSGLQWLHRLLQEPSRLWRRYLHNNPAFLLHIGLQLFRLNQYSLRAEGEEVRAQVAAKVAPKDWPQG